MTIKEKVLSLGLGPTQTAEILLLLSEAFTTGFFESANMAGLEVNPAIVADMAVKIGDYSHMPNPGTINLDKFSKVFGVDLTNDIP